MPDIQSALKAEISRIAKKEVRGEIAFLKKASSQYRLQIAGLRRQVEDLQKQLKRVAEGEKASAGGDGSSQKATPPRFRPAGLASHRQRLGLSAADFGTLIGVTGQSIYKWESGAARPRRAQLEAISVVRKMGRREALAKLQDPGNK